MSKFNHKTIRWNQFNLIIQLKKNRVGNILKFKIYEAHRNGKLDSSKEIKYYFSVLDKEPEFLNHIKFVRAQKSITKNYLGLKYQERWLDDEVIKKVLLIIAINNFSIILFSILNIWNFHYKNTDLNKYSTN